MPMTFVGVGFVSRQLIDENIRTRDVSALCGCRSKANTFTSRLILANERPKSVAVEIASQPA